MIMTAISPEAPKIAVSKVEENIKIDDMLCGRTISISVEQAKELKLALEVLFDDFYDQTEE
jgi:hypothetical protein